MIVKFQKKVYELVKKIPKGKIMTYGEIAKIFNTSPRAIGQALKKNYNPRIPCHRVIGRRKLGGYNRGIKNKIKLLKAEGVKIKVEMIRGKNDTPTYSNNCRTCRPWQDNPTGQHKRKQSSRKRSRTNNTENFFYFIPS